LIAADKDMKQTASVSTFVEELSTFLIDLVVALRIHTAALYLDLQGCLVLASMSPIAGALTAPGPLQQGPLPTPRTVQAQTWTEEAWRLLERPPPIRRWPVGRLHRESDLQKWENDLKQWVGSKQEVRVVRVHLQVAEQLCTRA
jgi:hypothetical protein